MLRVYTSNSERSSLFPSGKPISSFGNDKQFARVAAVTFADAASDLVRIDTRTVSEEEEEEEERTLREENLTTPT